MINVRKKSFEKSQEKRKLSLNTLSASSELHRNGKCNGNNPVLEAYYSTSGKMLTEGNEYFSPQVPVKKPGDMTKIFKSSRCQLPPIIDPDHSFQHKNSFKKKIADPIKAFNLGELSIDCSPKPKRTLNLDKPKTKFVLNPVKTNRSVSNKNVYYYKGESATNRSVTLIPKEKVKLRLSSTKRVNTSTDFEDELAATKVNTTLHYELSQAGLNDQGKPKTNQDNFLLIENCCDLENVCIFGILDGHGSNGHFASAFVKDSLTNKLTEKNHYLTRTHKEISSDLIYHKLVHKNFSEISRMFKNIESELIDAKFDVHFSGTTCVIVYHVGDKILCSNIGDSRAIIVSCDQNNNYYVENLSYDHKPMDPKEKARIESMGGEVHPYLDEVDIGGTNRVWVKGQNYPGIAISRTLGDEVAKSVGVSCECDVIEKDVNPEMCFIVAASDGVWEFLDNEAVKNIVIPYYIKKDPRGAAEKLIAAATKCWADDGDARDDITCVIYFLKRHLKKGTI